MIELTTQELTQILSARLIGENCAVKSISTDTRNPSEQGLFFALKGEHFDGHHYLAQAEKQGCVAVVVEKPCNTPLTQLIVEDSKGALGQLAHWLKMKIAPKTLAITGSSGKTTVKEMTASILAQCAKRQNLNEHAVLFTAGNFNNEIGVPLTLLRLTEECHFAVIELGANHQGEIAYTTHLVEPDVALVNNFACAHLEGFGSLEGVAKAKGEIFQGLKQQGVAIINADCHDLPHWQETIGSRKVQRFSLSQAVDFYPQDLRANEQGFNFTLVTPQGRALIQLPFFGAHNVSNALAASALAMNAGATLADIQQGLSQKMQVKGRLFVEQVSPNLRLFDDSYNANVASMKAGIDVLKVCEDVRFFVAGDMKELGEQSLACHQQVGLYAKQANLDGVFCFGKESAEIAKCAQADISFFSDNFQQLEKALISAVSQALTSGKNVNVLVKGSRSMQMERVIKTLKDEFQC